MTTKRAKHTDKSIECAVKHAENLGWRIEKSNGHPWGKLFCPYRDTPCIDTCQWCSTSVWSTPGNPQNHAKQLKRLVDRCSQFQEKRIKAAGDDHE